LVAGVGPARTTRAEAPAKPGDLRALHDEGARRCAHSRRAPSAWLSRIVMRHVGIRDAAASPSIPAPTLFRRASAGEVDRRARGPGPRRSRPRRARMGRLRVARLVTAPRDGHRLRRCGAGATPRLRRTADADMADESSSLLSVTLSIRWSSTRCSPGDREFSGERSVGRCGIWDSLETNRLVVAESGVRRRAIACSSRELRLLGKQRGVRHGIRESSNTNGLVSAVVKMGG